MMAADDTTAAMDQRQLDELEARALDAWRDELDQGLEEAEEGFAERVVSAAQSDLYPPLFAVEPAPEEPPPPRSRWGKAGRRMLFAGAIGLGAAGFAAATFLEPPASESPEDAAKILGLDDGAPDQANPNRLGEPELREDGIPGSPIPADLDEKIQTYVHDYGRDWGPSFAFHGTIAVVRDGEIRYLESFGTADPDRQMPNTPATRYRLGLLTEQFTAAAVMQLRDEGKLSLDDPVTRFIPEYPGGAAITVEHLLAHTSGIQNYTNLPYFHTWKNQPHTTEQLVARFASLPLEFVPGEDFSPTNSGYYLLGAIIERVSGQSYADYVQQHLFEPAGMRATGFGDAYETGEQARGHVWNDDEQLDPPDPIDMSVFGAAGGIVATPIDLIAWDAALYGDTILAPSTIEEMTTPGEYGYGYGWVVSEAYGQTVLSFPGAIDGFNGSMLRFLEDRTMVLVLCNTEVVPGSQVAEAIAMMVYGDTPPRRVEPAEVSIAPGVYPKYLGTYRLTDDTKKKYANVVDPERFALLDTVHVRRYGNRLYFDVPGHGLTWMHPMGRHRFFFKDHAGNQVSFAMGEDDRADQLMVHYKDASFELKRER
jgi:CubicO group peptidase (beta-lactamase class C family)